MLGEPEAAQALAANGRFDLKCEAIAQLPERCCAVMCPAPWRGFSNAEIATTLGLSENTVRVQLAREIRPGARFLRQPGEGR